MPLPYSTPLGPKPQTPLSGPVAFGQEPIIPPPDDATHPAPAPQEGTVEVTPACATCRGEHADGMVCQRIVDWILYRPALTPCCWGGGCGCGCHECSCLIPRP
jgi:hypothetical protein